MKRLGSIYYLPEEDPNDVHDRERELADKDAELEGGGRE